MGSAMSPMVRCKFLAKIPMSYVLREQVQNKNFLNNFSLEYPIAIKFLEIIGAMVVIMLIRNQN